MIMQLTHPDLFISKAFSDALTRVSRLTPGGNRVVARLKNMQAYYRNQSDNFCVALPDIVLVKAPANLNEAQPKIVKNN